jgi:hypothetical protein
MVSSSSIADLQEELMALNPEQLQQVVLFIHFLKFQAGIQNLDSMNSNNLAGIEETLYLLGIPGMKESIQDGLNSPIASCSRELEW